MTDFNIREQKIVEITYKKKGVDVTESFPITQLPATVGLKFIKKFASGVEGLKDEDMVDLICVSLSITQKQFEDRFTGKLPCIIKLVNEIISFNFEDVFTELDSEES